MSLHQIRVLSTSARIATIKLLRELTGCGLEQAVERIAGQLPFELELDAATQARLDDHAQRHGTRFDIAPSDDPEPDPQLDPSLIDDGFEVRTDLRYVDGSRKIHAIKLVRELTGLGLKDAKDVVDHAAVSPGHQPRRGQADRRSLRGVWLAPGDHPALDHTDCLWARLRSPRCGSGGDGSRSM